MRAGGRGFTYLGVLFILVVLGLTAAMAGVVWSHAQQREDERHLQFVGREFERAIERYAKRTKEPQPRYPRRLEDLLRDPRALEVRRDLRRIYVDPMNNGMEWGLVRLADGSIVGVHSLSTRRPLSDATPAEIAASGAPSTYRDWRFIAPSAQELVGGASAPDSGAASAPGKGASSPASPMQRLRRP